MYVSLPFTSFLIQASALQLGQEVERRGNVGMWQKVQAPQGRPKDMPQYEDTNDWIIKHPAALTASMPECLALCLFGVPGITAGKAGQATPQAQAARENAQNHVDHIIKAAAAAGVSVDVFVHAWIEPGSEVERVINEMYSPWLRKAKYEAKHIDDKLLSMATSMQSSVQLAQHAKNFSSNCPVLLMRHDAFWFNDFDLRVDKNMITTATWCKSPAPRHPTGCGPLRFSEFKGIHDYWMLGNSSLMRNYTDSLQACLESGDVSCSNSRAHFAIQMMADKLGLPENGLWRSHRGAVSDVDFTLYRWKNVSIWKLNRTEGTENTICDGREICVSTRNVPMDPGPYKASQQNSLTR
jgi:hypothetical protein